MKAVISIFVALFLISVSVYSLKFNTTDQSINKIIDQPQQVQEDGSNADYILMP